MLLITGWVAWLAGGPPGQAGMCPRVATQRDESINSAVAVARCWSSRRCRELASSADPLSDPPGRAIPFIL